MSSCFLRRFNKPTFELALTQTSLSPLHKTILTDRYVDVVRVFEARCIRIAILYHSMRIIVTVGSLIVPALLSIQYTDTGDSSGISDTGSFAYRVYWATWIISLLVTMSNGILSVFKVDKKYFFLHTTLEHLRSEGWQFLELTGRYSGFYTPHTTPTHTNQFVYFCHSVEKIKMKQVEEEYYKLSDTSSSHATQPKANGNGTTSTTENGNEKKPESSSLIPPTPLNNILEQAHKLPPELLRQLSTILPIMPAPAPAPEPIGNLIVHSTIPNPPSPETKPEDVLEGVNSNGATAPTLPVSKELQAGSASEKGAL